MILNRRLRWYHHINKGRSQAVKQSYCYWESLLLAKKGQCLSSEEVVTLKNTLAARALVCPADCPSYDLPLKIIICLPREE